VRVETIAIWGDVTRPPKGYKMLGILMVDPSKDLFFVVYAPLDWVRSASHIDLVKALTLTIERELLQSYKQRRFF